MWDLWVGFFQNVLIYFSDNKSWDLYTRNMVRNLSLRAVCFQATVGLLQQFHKIFLKIYYYFLIAKILPLWDQWAIGMGTFKSFQLKIFGFQNKTFFTINEYLLTKNVKERQLFYSWQIRCKSYEFGQPLCCCNRNGRWQNVQDFLFRNWCCIFFFGKHKPVFKPPGWHQK